MGKPSELFQWAIDALFPASANPWGSQPSKVEPPAGKQLTGHIPGEPLPAEYLNFVWNALGKWLHWLNGTFSGGDGDVLEVPAGLSVPGQFMLKGVTVLDTPGPGTYNVPAGVRALKIIAIGGGGAGGGAAAPSPNQMTVGGGGGSGAVVVKFIAAPAASYSYSVGAAGVGIIGAAGSNGGNSVIDGMTAGGGGGGATLASGNDIAAVNGGAPGAPSGTYDFAMGSEPGGRGFRLGDPLAGADGLPGLGGGGSFGRSPYGAAGSGFGAGGYGSVSIVSAQAGYNGAPGAIIIEEYV